MSGQSDDERGSAIVQQYAQLLSLAAHEFRTPASVVGGYLRMLQREGETPLGERQRRMVDEAARSCGRLVELIQELSDISKLDSDAAALRGEPLDLFAVAAGAAAHVHEGEDRGVHIRVSGPDTGAPCLGDLGRLSSALETMLRAVAREQPADTTIVADRRLIEADERTSAVIVVAAEADVERAFRAQPSALNEKRGGLGLALPIARRIVERHGGRVWSPTPSSDDDRALKRALLVSIPLVP